MTAFNFEKFVENYGCIGFFGIGKSNIALIKRLPKGIKIILRSELPVSRNSLPRGLNIVGIFEGCKAFSDFSEDILFLSPSVRRERSEFDAARARNIKFMSDLDIFLKENNSEILAVSGSDGKSTTTTLAKELISAKGGARLLGNIGVPFSSVCGESKKSFSVLELSSFQLRYNKVPSKRAVITNITPNHLNWHRDFKEYAKTKLSLLESAEEKIIFADDPYLSEYGRGKKLFALTSTAATYNELKAQFDSKLYITKEKGAIAKNGVPIISINEILRKEEHNIKNLMSAIALTYGFSSDARILQTAKTFKGLSHRCEITAEHAGVKFINSSIDTSASRTAATLNSFDKNVVIILGGKAKGTGYKELFTPISDHVKLAVITGENRNEILSDIKGAADTVLIDDFEEAVLYGASVAKSGDILLLSPASTSYDKFTSFEQRGNIFKNIVLSFIKNHKNR